MHFQIEARPKPSTKRTLIAWLQVETETELAAIAVAMRQFRETHAVKNVGDYTFKVITQRPDRPPESV